MAGRNRMPHHPAYFPGFRGGPPPLLNSGAGPLRIHPAALEEEFEFQYREICRILDENHQLVDENTVLKRDCVAAKDEINRLGQLLGKLRADKDSQSRDLIERCLKMEADLRAIEPVKEEVIRLRAEAQKLRLSRLELTVQIQGLTQDITHMRSENKHLNALRADVDGMRKELAEARRALELEKKANEEQIIQKQTIEKDLISTIHEVQKLQAEQQSMDRRALGFGGGSYGTYNGSPDMRYSNPGASYGDVYGRAWSQYDTRGPPRR